MISLVPKKHILLEQSLIGFGSQLISLIDNGKSIDDLWNAYTKSKHNYKHSFDDFILALDFLFMINAIKTEDGVVLCLS